MNVLRMTIQGLEMQKATLAAFQAMQLPGSETPSSTRAEPPAGSKADPAEAWWTLLQQAQPAQPSPPRPGTEPEKKPK
jgi:hypothetical protein